MMSPIKEAKPRGGFNRFLSSLPLFSKMFARGGWEELIKDCGEEMIDEKYVKKLLASYDVDNMRFRCASRKSVVPAEN